MWGLTEYRALLSPDLLPPTTFALNEFMKRPKQAVREKVRAELGAECDGKSEPDET